MKESEFIDHNKDKWSSYEKLIQRRNSDPDALRDVFIQVTDDLSYSRSHYPNRSVRVYLNHLARQIFDKLGQRKRLRFEPIKKFFTIEAPQLMYLARKEMIISLLVFVLSVCIGIYSSKQDPEFAKQILGESYVKLTEANIEGGDPMAIYRSGKEIDGFLSILINNARVDILILGLGMLFGVGAIFVLVTNGIMLGVFQYYFWEQGQGVFRESVLTIWLHGTIEISTIALVGGIGLMAGKGLLFPGSYSRYQSFRLSAGNASKLLLAILPFTVIAAVIEAFITGQRGAPDLIKVIFIILSLLLVAFYFIWLPFKVHRNIGTDERHETLRSATEEKELNIGEEKTIGKIISESFGLYKQNLGKNILFCFLGAMTLVLAIFYAWPENYHPPQWGFLKWFQGLFLDMLDISQSELYPKIEPIGLRLVKGVLLAIMMMLFLIRSLSTVLGIKARFSMLKHRQTWLTAFIILAISIAYHWMNQPILISSIILFGSLYVLTLSVASFIQKFHFKSEVSVVKVVSRKAFQLFLFFLAISSVSMFVMLLFNSILMSLFISFLRDLIPFGAESVQAIIVGTRIALFYAIFFGLLPFLFNALNLLILSTTEEYEAPMLKSELLKIRKA